MGDEAALDNSEFYKLLIVQIHVFIDQFFARLQAKSCQKK
jgi:hypothetical protein